MAHRRTKKKAPRRKASKKTTRRRAAKKTTRKKTTKRTPRKKTARRRAASVLRVNNIGRAVAVEYRVGRTTYRHEFKRGVELHNTEDGTMLIVSPVRVVGGEIHG